MVVEPLEPQELLEKTGYCKIAAFQMARSVTTRS